MRLRLSAFTLGFAIALGFATSTGALADEWKRFTNFGTGFAIELPLSRLGVIAEGAGRMTLRDENNDVQLDVFEVTNPQRLTLRRFEQMIEGADPARRITYRAAGGSWFVLSGYLADEREPTIFYAKFMFNPPRTRLSAFEISYPARMKAPMAPVVERIEDSLTAPR